MKWSLSKISTLGIIVGLACLILVHVACAYLFGVKRITYKIDPLFSQATHTQLVTFLQDLKDITHQPVTELYKHIQAEFPNVKTVALQRLPPDQLHVTITCHQPLILLNQEAVLIDSGLIVPKNLFADTHTSQLCDIKLLTKPHLSEQASAGLLACVTALTHSICKNYEVVWHDDLQAWLFDKQQPNFITIANAHTLSNPDLLGHAKTLKKELQLQGAFEKQSKKQWFADIRFDKQIVLSWKKGEANGKIIF